VPAAVSGLAWELGGGYGGIVYARSQYEHI
jgi:hypothetical protein